MTRAQAIEECKQWAELLLDVAQNIEEDTKAGDLGAVFALINCNSALAQILGDLYNKFDD